MSIFAVSKTTSIQYESNCIQGADSCSIDESRQHQATSIQVSCVVQACFLNHLETLCLCLLVQKPFTDAPLWTCSCVSGDFGFERTGLDTFGASRTRASSASCKSVTPTEKRGPGAKMNREQSNMTLVATDRLCKFGNNSNICLAQKVSFVWRVACKKI